MGLVTFSADNNNLALYFHGRVDSSSAPQVENETKEICSSNAGKTLIVDADDLEYISSAGLRVILRLRKENPDMKIINASSEVYEVFEMTGFTEMIPIEKGYRKLSVDGCEVIGQGANGKVYRLDPDTIVKVYFNPEALPDIHRERELARKAFVLGIPTAIPYDVVKVGDGYGSVFELLNAQSFAKLINKEPQNTDHYVELSVELLKKIHSTEVKPDDMPDMKEVVIKWAAFLKDYIPKKYSDKLSKMVADVPYDLHMMHGDYHIKNIMLQNGESLLIDMDTLCHGHPVFEFASVFNAYRGFSEVDHSIVQSFLGIDYDTAGHIWEKTLELYLNTTDKKQITEVSNKARIVGYTRLIRRSIRRGGLDIPSEKATIEHYIKELLELLDTTDSLVF